MDGDDAALVIICGWNWDCWDCDDPNAVPPSRALSEVINDLAMCGSDSPVRTIASLLAAGKLTAMGRWRWQEYKGFEHYQSEGNGVIPAARWALLLALQTQLADVHCEEPYERSVTLAHLGLGQTDKFYFDWREGCFSLATVLKGEWTSDAEFWFSAADIQIFPPQPDTVPPTGVFTALPAPNNTSLNKGGRPAIYDWEKAIAALVFKWADNGDWQPASKADVQRELGDWFAAQGASPSDSLLKQRARWLFQEFESRKLAGQ